MKIGFSVSAPETDAIVLLLAESRQAALDRVTGSAVQEDVTRLIEENIARSTAGSICDHVSIEGSAIRGLCLFGLGDVGKAHDLEIEHLGALLLNHLQERQRHRVSVRLDIAGFNKGERLRIAVLLAVGARLGGYRFDGHKTDRRQSSAVEELTFILPEPELADDLFGSHEASAVGACLARDLVTEPPNHLVPAAFAERCAKLSSEGLEVEILDEVDLKSLGMSALLSVGSGSEQSSSVAVMTWRGADEDTPLVALVGKGVCFDAGGLSLKSPEGMMRMKTDMAGAAAVVGTMKSLASRRATANVVGVVGLVENMPSGAAMRPGDVVGSLSGQTIEVLNTDYEGRLVLADLLTYAERRFEAKWIVDLGTLTGAVVAALGRQYAGLFCSDDHLVRSLIAAGNAVGEPLWHLPSNPGYDHEIASEIADVRNIGKTKDAAASVAARFLGRFLECKTWAHLDITGVIWSEANRPLGPVGATGFGVRLLDRWIRDSVERSEDALSEKKRLNLPPRQFRG